MGRSGMPASPLDHRLLKAAMSKVSAQSVRGRSILGNSWQQNRLIATDANCSRRIRALRHLRRPAIIAIVG
jgi:hypothetical protein